MLYEKCKDSEQSEQGSFRSSGNILTPFFKWLPKDASVGELSGRENFEKCGVTRRRMKIRWLEKANVTYQIFDSPKWVEV